MAHRRRILGALLVAGCTPHEGSQQPIAECPMDMVAVGGLRSSEQQISRLCFDIAEVTTATYATCVAAGGCSPALVGDGAACNLSHAERGAHPINCVSVEQAQAHCGWLGKRLPEDAEWAWAARGGLRDTPYPWGRRALDATRACHARGALGTCEVGSHPAGASPEGLLDLIGNVAEWTHGERPRLRGGSWHDEALDPAGLEPRDPATPMSGFRCVVQPFTTVMTLDVERWTPVKVVQEALPRLGEAPTRTPPTRPLANLSVLHRGPDGTRESMLLWPLGEDFVALPEAEAAALELSGSFDRATLPAALMAFMPVRALGDTILMRSSMYNDPTFIAVERSGAKIRWQAKIGSRERQFTHFVAPQTLVGSFYGVDSDLLLGVALSSGRELWRVHGDADAAFSRIKRAWSDDERGYAIGDRGLFAFDLLTGAALWSTAPFEPGCGVASGPGVLVIEDREGHRVLDAATGTVTGRIQSGRADCSWSGYEFGSGPGWIEGGQLLAFDLPDARDTRRLRAFDLSTGAQRWARAGLGGEVLVADHDAVYVDRGDEILLALDASSGVTRAEISIGTRFTVEVAPGGGAAGPLLRVSTDDGVWLLGRAAEPPVPEPFTVRGRLVPEDLPRGQIAGVLVRIGDHKVRTDAAGRFELKGRALGAVMVKMGDPRPPTYYWQKRVAFTGVLVPLTGRGSYRVEDIPAFWWRTD